MGSGWTKPSIPGTSITIVGERVTSAPPTFSEVVAVVGTHSWGPVGSDAGERPRLFASFPEWELVYGSTDSQSRRAVLMAFQGVGLPGEGGAGGVMYYRQAAAAAAAATIAINNTAPALALTLTAKYKGTDGNSISYTVGPDPRAAATKDLLTIRYKGIEQERFSYLRTSGITTLQADINRRSRFVVASNALNGTALTVTAGTSLAAGNSGTTLTGTEWTATFNALEFENFTLFAPANLTDVTIRASLVAWIQQMEANNRPVMAVVGGAAAETVSDALTRSAAINDPHIVNIGVGTWHDDLQNRDFSTAELAPRLAGVLAARGQRSALTFAELVGLHAVGNTGAAPDEWVAAKEGGVTVFGRSESGQADIHVVWGVTTFTNQADENRPYEVFSEPRHVRILDIFVRRIRLYANKNLVGDVPVNDDSRDALRVRGNALISDLLRQGLVLPEGKLPDNTTIPAPYFTTPLPNSPDLLDALLFEFGWQFARTANYVIGKGRVR